MDNYEKNARLVEEAVEQKCAFLQPDPFLAQRVLNAANEKGNVKVKRKFSVGLIVVFVLLITMATATAATLVWKQYVETYAQQEAEKGKYNEWPEQDRIALVQSLIDMGYLDNAADKVHEFASTMNDEERLAYADELVLTLIGQDDIREINIYSLTYAILGYEDFWTPEERIWWQGIQNIISPWHQNYTMILPDDSVISEQEAMAIAKDAILRAYELPEDALEQAWPVADLYITDERPAFKRWYVRYILYRNNDYEDHFEEMVYTVVVDFEGNVIGDEDRDILSVYDRGAYDVAMDEGASERGVIPTIAFMREYRKRTGVADQFMELSYKDKAAYSAEAHELLEALLLEEPGLYEMSLEAVDNTLWFNYGLPGEDDLTEEEALLLARNAITTQLNVPAQTVEGYKKVYSAFDITDPAHKMWKFIFINEDDWYGLRYRIQMDSHSGEIIIIESLPWKQFFEDEEYDKKYY